VEIFFCDDCTKTRALLPEEFKYEKPVRVCDDCASTLKSKGIDRFHQAGGHSSGVVRSSPGLVTKHTNASELSFFQNYSKLPEDIREFFFPKVDSVVDTLLSKTVTMEDLTFGYSKPCIMDIKMGDKTTDSQDSNIIKELWMDNKDKHTTTSELGCRLVALRKFSFLLQDFVSVTKSEANKISHFEQFEATIIDYFSPSDAIRLDVLQVCIEQMEKLNEWMSIQTQYKFVASSLLFVYDADLPLKATVKMIDFAHVFEHTHGSIDVGYLKGLNTVITILKKAIAI